MPIYQKHIPWVYMQRMYKHMYIIALLRSLFLFFFLFLCFVLFSLFNLCGR